MSPSKVPPILHRKYQTPDQAKAIAIHNATVSPLLSLPFELRSIIYTYTLGGNTIHVHYERSRSATNSPSPEPNLNENGDNDATSNSSTDSSTSTSNPSDRAILKRTICHHPMPSPDGEKFKKDPKGTSTPKFWLGDICENLGKGDCVPNDSHKDTIDWNILLTCRQAFSEARCLPYSKNTWAFVEPFELLSFVQQLSFLGGGVVVKDPLLAQGFGAINARGASTWVASSPLERGREYLRGLKRLQIGIALWDWEDVDEWREALRGFGEECGGVERLVLCVSVAEGFEADVGHSRGHWRGKVEGMLECLPLKGVSHSRLADTGVWVAVTMDALVDRLVDRMTI